MFRGNRVGRLDGRAPAIGLLGDLMLGRRVAERLGTTPAAELRSPDMCEVCATRDALVLNLECCVPARGARTSPIPREPGA